jgi:hypothetical protein
MNPLIQLRKATPVFLVALACFGLSPQARAVCQDACLTNFNTVQGNDALFSLTFGVENTAIGFGALFSDTSGSDNTAIGFRALSSDTTGRTNTAIGSAALFRNRTGDFNTATGVSALVSNTSGFGNTATGAEALISNTTADNNTATGFDALFSNTTGFFNTATGASALYGNTTGIFNTADGFGALANNTTGDFNTATGVAALLSNTTGSSNTATGFEALFNNFIGSNNTADGRFALFNNTMGSSNIALGFQAGFNLTTGNNNIDIGNGGVAGESSTIRIGIFQTRTFIAGISGAAVTGSPVVVNANGRLGVTASSARFKEAIKPMDKASEAILALKPVSFRYKPELDPDGIPQFGLIAEQVEKVNPHLVARDADGKVNTVRYEAVNAMLLNEFLKEHRKVEQLEKQVEALTAGLQKLSAQIQLNNSAQQVAVKNQ